MEKRDGGGLQGGPRAPAEGGVPSESLPHLDSARQAASSPWLPGRSAPCQYLWVSWHSDVATAEGGGGRELFSGDRKRGTEVKNTTKGVQAPSHLSPGRDST